MRDIWYGVQAGVTVLGGWLGLVLGGLDGLIYVLIAFVVVDYITGVMCAVSDRTLSSNIGFRGIFRKILIFVMVAIGHLIDTHVIGLSGIIGDGAAVRTAIVAFYLSNEVVSLMENAARLGLPIPERLTAILAQLHNNTGNKD